MAQKKVTLPRYECRWCPAEGNTNAMVQAMDENGSGWNSCWNHLQHAAHAALVNSSLENSRITVEFLN